MKKQRRFRDNPLLMPISISLPLVVYIQPKKILKQKTNIIHFGQKYVVCLTIYARYQIYEEKQFCCEEQKNLQIWCFIVWRLSWPNNLFLSFLPFFLMCLCAFATNRGQLVRLSPTGVDICIYSQNSK